jgi:hypothetical protein
MSYYTIKVFEAFESEEDPLTGAVCEGKSLGWTAVATYGTPGSSSWGSVTVGQGFASAVEARAAALENGFGC